MNCAKDRILVVGSVALDSIETPFGKADRVLGGSAVYFSISASLFNPVNLVGVVGKDFPTDHVSLLLSKGIDLDGLNKDDGDTFYWDGSYSDNLNEAVTKETRLNVFERFNPVLPKQYCQSPVIFLANIDPQLQLSVLAQTSAARLVVCDTMNLWINSKKDVLAELFGRVDIVIINEGEAKLFTGEHLLINAAKKIKEYGPKWIVIKKGEHGVFAYNGEETIILPSYPVEKIVDPTGAGDSFAGGFMGYLAENDSSDRVNIRRALLYATIVASFTIESFSVDRLCAISRSDVERRLENFLKKL